MTGPVPAPPAAVTRVCRGCGEPDLVEVLDLGEQYLSDFRDDDTKPPRYPLRLLLCPACTLCQLAELAPRELMYTDRYGFRSGVNEAVRTDLASVVNCALRHRPDPGRWLDIACNDGTLLSLVPPTAYRAGVDPVAVFAPLSRRHADRIVADYFTPADFPGERFDVVTSISMFYDLPDPGGFVANVAHLLAPDGVWVIQQNDLLTMLEQTAFDNICHEHATYFSLAALQSLLHRHGLEVVEVSLSPVNGGCLRTVVAHTGRRPVGQSVAARRVQEHAARLHDPATFAAFADRVKRSLADLRALVLDIGGRGERVYIYGASTRGGTIWQAAGLDWRHLPYAVERQPGKVGKRIASIGVPIVSEAQARADRPEYMLVSPWFFRDVFVDRERDYLATGGRLIFPLPELEVIGA